MNFKPLPIPESLQGIIQSVWTLGGNAEAEAVKSFRTLADSSPGLIFQQPDKGRLSQDGKLLTPFFLYGAATTHNTIEVSGEFDAIGIFFHPSAVKKVFGIDAAELTDTCIDSTLLKGSDICRRLEETVSAEGKAALLAAYIDSQLQKNRKDNDNILSAALSEITASAGLLSVKELSRKLNLSERSLERKFKASVGLSPALYARIYRFRETLKQLQAKDFDRLSDIAFGNDYADQSHFIRSFKEFSGFTPKDYLVNAGKTA